MSQEKVAQFEAFLNDKLKPDLNSVLQERDRLYAETAEFLALKNAIAAIKAAGLRPGEPLKTRVDLGCNFYAHAEVPKPDRIVVEAGLGFFVELTLDEALALVDKRTALLEARTRALSKEACKAKASLKIVLEGLRELQGLSGEDLVKKRRDRRMDLLG